MEKEKPKQEQEQIIIEPSPEKITIGDVSLTSYQMDSIQLSNLLIQLLQQKDVKEYLNMIEKKKLFGGNSYFG